MLALDEVVGLKYVPKKLKMHRSCLITDHSPDVGFITSIGPIHHNIDLNYSGEQSK
jgi:hypothetical protein